MLRMRSAGSGTPRGVWNSSLDIKKGDTVSDRGGSFMALRDVAPGGQPPAVDTVNWMQLASGGGLIAGPAQLTANFAFALSAAALQDVTGMSLVIPAGSPTCEVVAKAPMIQFVFAAGATVGQQATLRLLLVDEGNVAIGQSIVRVTAAVAGASTHWQQSQVAADLAAIGAAKTIKLSGWLDTITNLTSCTLWAGAGTGTPPSTATLGPVKMDAKAR
jgi:hypothetical protein